MEVEGSSDRVERAARNQSLFRQVNERLEDLASAFKDVARGATFTCECADLGCIEQMWLTLEEYEDLRSRPNRFAVLPGHVYPDVENVERETDRFVTVAKIGVGVEIAKATYPRS